MITLNDTALKGNRKINLPNFFSYCKNRLKNKGGVATVISNTLKNNTVKITEGDNDEEFIVVRFNHTTPAINVVNWYGCQEGRSTKNKIMEMWENLRKVLDDILSKSEGLILIGDFNRAMGSDKMLGIIGNKENI